MPLLVAFGAVAQRLGLLPLAVRPELARNAIFQALAVFLFAATSIGWIALAATVIARW
jgi:hypothetical protein